MGERGGNQADAERVLGSERVFVGTLIAVRRDRVATPAGRETTREVVEHPGAVAVVPLLPDGRVVLVRQYRHAVGRALLEIPAGTLDRPGESAEAAAARELAEETGYRAGRLTPLASFYTAPGFCTELLTVFLATDLTPGEQATMDDEAIAVELVPLDDAPALAARGELADAKTLVGLLTARDARSR